MATMSYNEAVEYGLHEMNKGKSKNERFEPSNKSRLILDIGSDNGSAGVIIIPVKGKKGEYEVMTLHSNNLPPDDGLTFEDVWSCTAEHYGLTGATFAVSAAGFPLEKSLFGQKRVLGAGSKTNLISFVGHKFYPRLYLPKGVITKTANKLFKTARVFGVIGRASPYGAVAMGVIDAGLIGKCVYDRHVKK